MADGKKAFVECPACDGVFPVEFAPGQSSAKATCPDCGAEFSAQATSVQTAVAPRPSAPAVTPPAKAADATIPRAPAGARPGSTQQLGAVRPAAAPRQTLTGQRAATAAARASLGGPSSPAARISTLGGGTLRPAGAAPPRAATQPMPSSPLSGARALAPPLGGAAPASSPFDQPTRPNIGPMPVPAEPARRATTEPAMADFEDFDEPTVRAAPAPASAPLATKASLAAAAPAAARAPDPFGAPSAAAHAPVQSPTPAAAVGAARKQERAWQPQAEPDPGSGAAAPETPEADEASEADDASKPFASGRPWHTRLPLWAWAVGSFVAGAGLFIGIVSLVRGPSQPPAVAPPASVAAAPATAAPPREPSPAATPAPPPVAAPAPAVAAQPAVGREEEPRPALDRGRAVSREPATRRGRRLPVVVDYDAPRTRGGVEVAPTASEAPDIAQALERAREAYRAGNRALYAGNATGALTQYRQALGEYPAYAAGYRGIGLAYTLANETALARAAFERYLQMAPGARDAGLIRRRLEGMAQ